jgi:hypothetical protein
MFFFALGFILYSDERFTQAIHRDWPILLAVGCITLVVLVAGFLAGLPLLDWNETPGIPQFYILQVLQSMIAICFSLSMLFMGMRFLDFTNKWLRYCLEAVLPFFVLHQPVIIVIAFFVVQWSVGIVVKLPIVVLSSFFVTMGLYELVIKRVHFLRVAFGMKS